MSDISWFNFENKDKDFPFYKKNPHVPKWGWIVLLFAMILGLILSASDSIVIIFLSCVVIILPVLYFLKWDYKAIFQKPSLRDVALALALCVGYLAYALIMVTLLENVGIAGADLVEHSTVSMFEVIPLIFSLMTEEFLKFIPFMFFLRLVFKYSENRKLSVVLSMIVTMVFFASLHSLSLETFIFAIFVQGLGSIFEFFAYIKTKNILVSYICHYATDFLIYMTIFLGL
ncbi:CPBP family glutamic-type intramembrane protease [Methanobrevibacter thaueri]|uniref:CAAX prenyl protease 2/Lysostaphin resistance protein A-like domain-containing protein n=1 Tax=Methanobrevibacter thaueri TaxID=190975 RepID=A0A315XQL2_9EURY|nr:CPBP family glutamic-type intramembrane protease [Methanobrevibacter thaueri]PWB88234.1 hypothetical protein MBBTH_01370 [Methanobrevibacter thaueri]